MPVYEPTTNPGTGNFAQSSYTSTGVDITTTSSTFVTMLTITLTTFGGKLICLANASTSNSNANAGNYFRLTVDGISYGATAQRYINTPAVTGALIAETNVLSAGSHTIKLEWRAGAGTAQCRPVTQVDIEFASLLVFEVNA